MKKLNFFLMLVISSITWFHSTAQIINSDVSWKVNRPGVELPSLIFTEFRSDANSTYYLEMTNIGQETLDLSNFSIISVATYTRLEGTTDSTVMLGSTFHYIPLEGSLPGGESYVMTPVFDAWHENLLPTHNVTMAQNADMRWHQPEPATFEFLGIPEYEAYDFDSVSVYYNYTNRGGTAGWYLEYKFLDSEGNRDSTLIDNVNVLTDPYEAFGSGGAWQGNYQFPVAGITEAIDEYIMVRKSTVTSGNLDWNLSRGTDLETSEWIPVPEQNNDFDIFTTVGTHGNFQLDYVSNDPQKYIVDADNSTLTVPWEEARGGTLNRAFTLGDGMSWSYAESEMDSISTNVVDGDVFAFYALGDKMERDTFVIRVSPPTADVAVVFSKRQIDYVIDNWTQQEIPVLTPGYAVTSGLEPDSIYNIPFGTRIDTMLNYLYKPEKANWEVITGGETRADVKEDDILRVTSEDGSVTKEYVIKTNEYEPSDNANLSMITWPEVDLNVYWEWESDTLPEFEPMKASYKIILQTGTTTIPALQFQTEDVTAQLDITRAIDINGSLEQRTTKAIVTAEDGLTTKTYRVVFELETVPLQPNNAEPFISEMIWGMNFAYNLEIYNPGNQELDLNRYMIVQGNNDDNLAEALARLEDSGNKYKHHHVPGMRFRNDDDNTSYNAEKGYLVPDNVTNTIVQPGDVWVAGAINDGGWEGGRFYPARYFDWFTDGDHLDFIWYGYSYEAPDSNPFDAVNDEFNLNPWGAKYSRYNNPCYMDARSRATMFLLKIDNDSILDGYKDVTDPDDYIIVDRFQRAAEFPTEYWCAGRLMTDIHWNAWSLRRTPDVYQGVTERAEGFGDDFGRSSENAEWTVFNARDADYNNMDLITDIGIHSMNPVQKHVSSVTSVQLLVSEGYEGDLTITGSVDGIKVSEIAAMLDKADPDQMLYFINGADTLTDDETVAADMTLLSVSADGKNSTTYTLVNSPLDSDVLLVAVDGSGLTVSLSGTEGTITGVEPGSTIKSLLEGLEVPQKAVMNVVNGYDDLLSLETLNFDSVKVDRIVGPGVFLEVVAENGDKAVYSLDFGHTASDAMLYSDLFTVNQEVKAVYGVPEGITPMKLMSLVYPNQNASAKVVDKLGYERTVAILYSDDVIEVTSADESVTVIYSLNFLNEVNTAPAAVISGTTEITSNEPVAYTATVTDDGLPEGASHTYLWEVTSGNAASVVIATPDQMSTDITFTESGTFEISFTVSDGDLSNTVSTTVSSAVGVDKLESSSLKIYPNPASDLLFVEFNNENNSRASVNIIDISGRVLFTAESIHDKLEIDMNSFASGIYFVSVKIGNTISVHKLKVVKK